MTSTRTKFLLSVLLGLMSSTALAQDAADAGGTANGQNAVRNTTPTSARGNGNGIALSRDGNARLHLMLDTAVGFDSNPFAVSLSRPDFAGDGVFRIRPGLEVNNNGSLIALNAYAYADYGILPGLVRPDTRNFLLYQGGANANLEINRGGAFTFGVGDTLVWNRDPGILAIGSIFNRLNNTLNGAVAFRPGGGTLSAKLGYAFGFEKWFDFDNNASELVRRGSLDQMSHLGTLRIDYRFLPKTGGFLLVNGGVHLYPFDNTNTNPTSFPLNASVGLMGQFTPRLSGLVMAGYGNTFTLDTTRLDGTEGPEEIQTLGLLGFIGQAELRFQITDRAQISGGVQRRLQPIPIYQFSVVNRFYARYAQQLGSNMNVTARAGYGLYEFGAETLLEDDGRTTTPVGRLDNNLDLIVQLDYHFSEIFSVGISNDVNLRLTNAADEADLTNFSYFRNETLVIASLHY